MQIDEDILVIFFNHEKASPPVQSCLVIEDYIEFDTTRLCCIHTSMICVLF